MPCYQIITTQVEFKVENIDFLRKALERDGWKISQESRDHSIIIANKGWRSEIAINLKKNTVTSQSFKTEKELIAASNAIRRAYSLTVIDHVAGKQKWIKKQVAANRVQLQRY